MILFRELFLSSVLLSIPSLYALTNNEEAVITASSSALVTDSKKIAIFPIHGTFGQDGKWYREGGSFFEALRSSATDNAEIVPFRWSGELKEKERFRAAERLANLIQNSFDDTYDIYLVGHSYGGEVAVIAANLLYQRTQQKYKIKKIFTLGTPIFEDKHVPNMEAIEYVFNIFSYGDIVQPVFGTAKRVYESHPRIWNIELKKKGMCPDHGDIHCDEVAVLLPIMELLVRGNDTTRLHLREGGFSIEEDLERELTLMLDQKNIQNILRLSVEFMRRGYHKQIPNKVFQSVYSRAKSLSERFRRPSSLTDVAQGNRRF